jgi:hypothetical protein
VDRVFHFTNTTTPQSRQEITNLVRTMAYIRQAAIDNSSGVLAVSGTPGQISLAEWLFGEMDKPADSAKRGMQEYRIPGSTDDVVRVFYLTNVQSPQNLQEIINAVRSVADVQRIMANYSQKALTMRGTVDQAKTTEWMIDQLDKPVGASTAGVHEFRLADAANPVIRVFNPKHTETPQALQELVNSVRSLSDLQRVVAVMGQRAITLRGTTEQAALSEWLINELDQAPAAQPATPSAHEYRLAGSPIGVVRVFYPTRVETPQALQEVVNLLRGTTGIQRMVAFNATRAVGMRGTGDQVGRAEQLLKERDKI